MSKTAFITGASNGIGKGLAFELASRGYGLALSARNEDKLNEVAKEILQLHPGININVYPLDVTDHQAVQASLNKAATDFQSIDLVIANAGIGGGGKIGSGKLVEDMAVIDTNVKGVIATVDTAVELFTKQKNGHIVAISSVAAFRGMPNASSYCASKAAVDVYMQSLETELLDTPIHCTTLFPGYIDTDINKKLKSRPFLITVEQASPMMVDMIEKKVVRSTIPAYPWAVVGRLLKILPKRLLSGKKAA